MEEGIAATELPTLLLFFGEGLLFRRFEYRKVKRAVFVFAFTKRSG